MIWKNDDTNSPTTVRKYKRGETQHPEHEARWTGNEVVPPDWRSDRQRKQRKYQHTTMHHQWYSELAAHQDKQDIFPKAEQGRKKGTKTYPNIIHSMQPQQFAVKATWTQFLPPGRPGTFLPWLRSPSFQRFRQPCFSYFVDSGGSIAVLAPRGTCDRQYTNNNRRNNTNTAPRKKTKYKLKWKEARPSTGSLPNSTN